MKESDAADDLAKKRTMDGSNTINTESVNVTACLLPQPLSGCICLLCACFVHGRAFAYCAAVLRIGASLLTNICAVALLVHLRLLCDCWKHAFIEIAV